MIPALFQTLRETLEQPLRSTRLTIHGVEDSIRIAVESGQVTCAHYGALRGLQALRAMYELPDDLFAPPSLQTKLWNRDCEIRLEDMIKSLFDHTLDWPDPSAMALLKETPHLTLGYAVKHGTPLKFSRAISAHELVRAFNLAQLPLLKQLGERSLHELNPGQRSRLGNGAMLYPLANKWIVIAHVEGSAGERVAQNLERAMAAFAPLGELGSDSDEVQRAA